MNLIKHLLFYAVAKTPISGVFVFLLAVKYGIIWQRRKMKKNENGKKQLEREQWQKKGFFSRHKRKAVSALCFLAILACGSFFAWRYQYQLMSLRTEIFPVGELEMAPESLIATMKTKGCVFDGVLTGYGSTTQVKTDMLKRSGCRYLHRAIETWNTPPNFGSIKYAMDQIKKGTGKDFIYSMFIAESIKTDSSYYYPYERRYFNFSAMCGGGYGAWGAGTCKPSFEKEEYRKYVQYISEKAIDMGVQEITFGQIYYQDPKWKENPKAEEVVERIRRYASSKSKSLAVGAQTNDMDDEKYLKIFDFITGGVGQHPDGYIEEGNPCWSYYYERDGYCWAMLWDKKFKTKANNVFVYLDWNADFYDDMNRFVRLGKEGRAKFLGKAYDFFLWRDVGFLMPLGAVLDGSGRGCYGSERQYYHASNAYSCKDEDAINAIFRGEGTLPDYSKFVSQSVPEKMVVSESYPVSVTMENTSFHNWSQGFGYVLGSQNPGGNSIWGISSANLEGGQVVGHGDQITFNFYAVAPSEPGYYNFQWRMRREDEPFGEFSENKLIEVVKE